MVSTKASDLRHLLRVALGQEEIGRRIRQARDEAGLTQRQLADLIGVETQTISRYERAESDASAPRLRQIAEATGKPLSFLVADPEEAERAAEAEERILQAIESQRREILALVQELRRELREALGDEPDTPGSAADPRAG